MNKLEFENKGGIYLKLLKKLKEKEKKCSKKYIPFPEVFQSLCSPFALTKQDAWEVLMIFRDLSIIEFVPCHGIVLNYQIKK